MYIIKKLNDLNLLKKKLRNLENKAKILMEKTRG